jgi:alpha-glucosidase
MFAPFEAAALRSVVEKTEALLPEGAWPTWHASNHDFSRLSTRWAGGDPAKVRVALLLLLTLRGTAFLYAGDEIGFVDGEVPHDEMLDPVGIRFYPYAGRDPERTPIPWHDGPGGGFTSPGVKPWLPMADPSTNNVAHQANDPSSVLAFCRRVIAARRASDDLALGAYHSLPSADGTWAYARGDGTVVLLNMSDEAAEFVDVRGRVIVATDGALEGAAAEGTLTLGPWTGAVIAA